VALESRKIDVSILTDKNISPDKYRSYCVGMIALYEEALNLPNNEAAALIRYFVGLK
jgi:hypothetical protein